MTVAAAFKAFARLDPLANRQIAQVAQVAHPNFSRVPNMLRQKTLVDALVYPAICNDCLRQIATPECKKAAETAAFQGRARRGEAG